MAQQTKYGTTKRRCLILGISRIPSITFIKSGVLNDAIYHIKVKVEVSSVLPRKFLKNRIQKIIVVAIFIEEFKFARMFVIESTNPNAFIFEMKEFILK